MYSCSKIIIQDYQNKCLQWDYQLDITTLINIFNYYKNVNDLSYYHIIGNVHVKLFGDYICIYEKKIYWPNEDYFPSKYLLISSKKLLQYKKNILNIIRREQYTLEAL
jgi:hypothetical protein